MFCKNCGAPLNGASFCTNCGTQQVPSNPVNTSAPKSKTKLFVILGIVGVAIILGVVLFMLLKKDNVDSVLANTSWTTRSGSQAVFTKDRITWYESKYDHTDNYYAGKYKVYRGKEGIDYISNKMPEYGLTADEIYSSIERSNGTYSVEDFILIYIEYDEFKIEGSFVPVTTPVKPWFGFLLNDETFLDVANMNTGTYYAFTKES